MTFFERIGLIRKITNGSDYESIGFHDKPVTFYQEKNCRFAIVSDISVAKAALNSPCFAAFNHFPSFLPPGSEKALNHICEFIEMSPEFQEGHRHDLQSAKTKQMIDRYQRYCSAITSDFICNGLASWRQHATIRSAEELSKTCLSLFLTEAGRAFHKKEEYAFRPEHITDDTGFFSAAPRFRRLLKFNQGIHEQLSDSQLMTAGSEDHYMLMLLRIMGSAPMHTTLTSSINRLIERHRRGIRDVDIPNELSGKRPFSRCLPTRFVLRQVREDVVIAGIQFKANDVVYLFLAQAAGCPIRKTASMPFGTGKHFCPGHSVSEQCIRTCLSGIIASGAHQDCTMSKARNDSISSFLSFARPD